MGRIIAVIALLAAAAVGYFVWDLTRDEGQDVAPDPNPSTVGPQLPKDATEVLVPTSLSITGDGSAFTSIGESRTFQAQILDQKGGAMSGVPVTWSSSNAAVVEVSSSGQATARSNGTATLTASSGSATASTGAKGYFRLAVGAGR